MPAWPTYAGSRTGATNMNKASREHWQNEVALKLAALDLMSERQIRLCAEAAGLDLPNTQDCKVLIEAIRRQLLQ